MKDILRLAILVLVGYAIYTAFVGREIETADDMETDSPVRCFERVDQAGDAFASALRSVSSPPVDQTTWRDRAERVEDRLSIADAACTCGGEACFKARESVDQLRTLLDAVDDGIQRDVGPPHDTARRYDAFRRTWEQAKAISTLEN
ncbi:MAG: hypothetical protein AAGE94_15320 [Acidobacteriota bacterium]